jgi:hypothetical protein
MQAAPTSQIGASRAMTLGNMRQLGVDENAVNVIFLPLHSGFAACAQSP